MRKYLASSIRSLLLAMPGLAHSQSDLPAFIDQVRAAFDVPGIAVAIVKDDRIVFEQGVGQRDLSNAHAFDYQDLSLIKTR
jgi:CubicO group peptidase (beta-lactamase class C family)